MLEVDVRRRLGAFSLEARFSTGGRLTALWGPSGSGKTSLVNMIAGLDRPDAGRIAVDGRVLVDTGANLFMPGHGRRIGYVFQDARLFPHLTVAQNLRFGRFFAPRGERYADFDAVVELLGIADLLSRRPRLLSGGEKQRVAIGRALLASPKLILMDEPLASLDDKRKAEIMPFIERLRDELAIPIVYVSHAVAEVARLATDIVMLEGGKLVAAGPARDVMNRLDLLPEGERGEGGAVVDLTVTGHDDVFGLTVLRSAAGEWLMPRLDLGIGRTVRARVRARDIMIATRRPEGLSAVNVLAGTILSVTAETGADALVRLDCGGDVLVARITRHSVAALELRTGMQVFAVVKAATFDREKLGRGSAFESS